MEEDLEEKILIRASPVVVLDRGTAQEDGLYSTKHKGV